MIKNVAYCAVLLLVLCLLIANTPNNKIKNGSGAPGVNLSGILSSMMESSASSEPIVSSMPYENSTSTEAPKPCTYEIRARLHAGMPEYRFVASGIHWDWDADAYAGGTGFVMGLKVYDQNDKLILSGDFSQVSDGEVIGYPIYNEMMDTMGLHVIDVNFDGYKDVIILNNFGGAHSNTWYDCWLWDAKTSSFVPSKSFAEICNPALDAEKKCIYSSGGSGASLWGGSIYKYIGNQFVVTNNLAADDCSTLVETKLQNGKMVTVREVTLNTDEKTISKEREYYKNNKLWQLDNPRWYMSGGHKADEWLK